MVTEKVKNILLTLFTFFSVIAFAQDTSMTDGFTVFRYENGKVSSEGTVENGKPNGYWKTYYESGVLKSEGNRKNFIIDSLWKFYNEEGKIILEINYADGIKNGIKTTYLKDETVKENYVNDIKEGYTSFYYPDGKLRLSVKFIKGREQGTAREFAESGEVITLLEYKNGYLIGKEKVNRYVADSLKNGKWVTFFPNGNIQSEEYYKYGVKNGYFKEYSVDGSLLTIVKYVDGVLIKDAEEVVNPDIKKEYYPGGQLKKAGSFKDNIPEGPLREYSEDGEIISTTIYSKGKIIATGRDDGTFMKQGLWKEFYETGELKSIGKYINGKKIGDWKYYFSNGKTEQAGVYIKNGKPDGEWVWYYSDGDTLMVQNYSEGLLNGRFIEYSDSGTFVAKGQYIDGFEEGYWKYQLGDIKSEGTYSEGRRYGIWKNYFDNGKLNFEGSFVDDNPDGKHYYYWDNGYVKENGTYIMGKRNGNWCRYNYDGTLFMTTLFRNGAEIKYDGVKIKPPVVVDN